MEGRLERRAAKAEMNGKIDISKPVDYSELKEQLKKIDWPFRYGSIKVQIRDGIPALLVMEQTIKLD